MTMSTKNRLLATREAAMLLGLKPATLDAWRYRRQGPSWIVIGSRAIRYRRSVLEQYIRLHEIEPIPVRK